MTVRTDNPSIGPSRADTGSPAARRLVILLLCLLNFSLIGSVIVTSSSTPTALASTQDPVERAAVSTQPAPPTIPAPVTAGSEFVQISGTQGYWRIGKTADGVWWFISPEGRREFLNTVTTVQPFQLGRREAGPHYISRDWQGGLDTSTGDTTDWAKKTLERIREAGFKGLGAWCHPVFHTLDVPISRDLNLWAHAGYADRLLYSPNWRSIVEDAVARQVPTLSSNRNLVGYYTDNELDWSDGGAGPATYFDHLNADDPNRLQVIRIIRTLWPTIQEFNAAWKMELASFEELGWTRTLPREPADAYSKLLDAWLYQLARDYFEITSSLVRKYDPNHLILGVRFKGHAPEPVVRASRGLTDAVSLNYYPSDAKIDADMFPMIPQEAQQPLIITEYAFHSLDGRSGNRNTFGFSAQVLDQQARADGYRLFTQRVARVPYIIGADWFQWSDEPPSGRTTDGEDVNFGIVDVDDRPYELLTAAIRETTPLLNDLHARSPADLGIDISRERFSEGVSFDVPYLASSLRINGELSDWPRESKLLGIRHSQTLGNERSNLPLPTVYVAWNERGLYFGVEVFDRDIEGAPANGWWWTRDAAEFFIATKPPEPGQSFYTPHDHQFFFVPIAFPGQDGNTGTVGRWHRLGDAIADHQIPQPLVQCASRVFPDSYVFEMFIPAEAMHGFDASGKTPMALNIHVRNFQNAIEYFWSAPKQVQTQFRPGTWGRINLLPKADLGLVSGE